jgi:excisionase family DNA binding protein
MTQHKGASADAKVEFHRPREAADILRIGRNQLYAAIAAGEIRAVKLGGQYRISDSEITRLKRGAAS